MKQERAGHSLQTTALVNEAYMRLVDYKRMQWQNRAHFFAVSAQMMRRILVDHARRHNLKRGGRVADVSKLAMAVPSVERGANLVSLREAMNTLAQFGAPRLSPPEVWPGGRQIVEETAEVLKVSS